MENAAVVDRGLSRAPKGRRFYIRYLKCNSKGLKNEKNVYIYIYIYTLTVFTNPRNKARDHRAFPLVRAINVTINRKQKMQLVT